MPLNLGDTFPNLDVETTRGNLNIHDYFGESWGVLFSHPANFTPVCTTELAEVVNLIPKLQELNTKVLALSCDPVESHKRWLADIMAVCKCKTDTEFPYPIIADESRDIAVFLGMVDPDEKDKAGLPLTCRAVFIVGPDKKMKLSLLYPATTGRNFDEIVRVIESLQRTAYKKVATPANWKPGDPCMILPSVSKEAAAKLFPDYKIVTVPSGKEYMRMTDH